MMRSIVHYYDTAKKAILESSGEHKITFAVIETTSYAQLNELSKLKFLDPKLTREEMLKITTKLVEDSSTNIRKLTDK